MSTASGFLQLFIYASLFFILTPATVSCTWESVAVKYPGLNPYLLHAIAVRVLVLKSRIVSPSSKNGSVDIGLMQINSAWLLSLRLTSAAPSTG